MVVVAAGKRTGLWRAFFMNCDAQTFCLELCKFGLEGLCACVYGNYHSFIPAKAPPCHRGPFYPTQKYPLQRKWWLKLMEETSVEDLCDCCITSTASIRCLHKHHRGCGISYTTILDWPQNTSTHVQNEGNHIRL
jgi:hypothetical protein